MTKVFNKEPTYTEIINAINKAIKETGKRYNKHYVTNQYKADHQRIYILDIKLI